jgi:ABC-type bacteriocin/lantibiotic exporter with double-glycine peptidase domain
LVDSILISDWFIPKMDGYPFEDEDEPKNFDISRITTRLGEYLSKFKAIPEILFFLIEVCSSAEKFRKFLSDFWTKSQQLPVVIFYKYLWQQQKGHFFFNIFVNYLFPMILEAMPWYFSQNKLGKELRGIKNQLQHSMVKGEDNIFDTAKYYILYTTIYCFLQTLDRHLRNRVLLLNKFDIKRLVLERLVYSEVWALDFYEQTDLERRISYDIQNTIQMFSVTVPNIFSNSITIFSEFRELYTRREQIDVLAIFRPMTSILVWRVSDWLKETFMGKKMATPYIDNENVKLIFSSTIDGITDLQLNNAQSRQLNHFDDLVNEEFAAQEDLRFFLNRYYSIFTGKSVFDFLTEIFITTKVMQRRGLTHEQFKKVQLDIDHVFNQVRKTGNLIQKSYRVLENQSRIIHLMNLPNFQFEELKRIVSLEKIHVMDLKFSYQESISPALDFKEEITFERDKVYVIIGQNRSGKSTLVHLMCRLHTQEEGVILYDGVDSREINRTSIRSQVSYVAQKPYLFSGTIRENILLGDPNASNEDVMVSAEKSGIFTFGELKTVKRSRKDLKQLQHQDPFTSPPPKHTGEEEVDVDPFKTPSETPEGKILFSETTPIPTRKSTPFRPKFDDEMTSMMSEMTEEKKLETLDHKTVPRGSNLSGGFQQSVALARIFLKKDAKFIILDESTSAMDPIKKRSLILPHLLDHVKKNRIGLILVTHDMNDLKIADHIIVMSGGKVECQGDLDSISSNEIVKKMIGEE